MPFSRKIQHFLLHCFVETNQHIRKEYASYLASEMARGGPRRIRKFSKIAALNWRFRIWRRILRRLGLYRPPKKIAPPRVRLPWLEGSESEAFRRQLDVYLAKDLMPWDIVSFDIFDTLILRPFARPQDLFMVVGGKLDVLGFDVIRRQAERTAMEKARALSRSPSVTFREIYEEVERRTGIPAEKGMAAEFETELQFCFANPYIQRIYKILREQGKRIILCSDMYLPGDMMARLLTACGYEGWEKLYVSCDYGVSKASGGLFGQIRRDFPACRIAHVGDNYASDWTKARQAGLHAFFYKSCHDIGNPYRADGMSCLTGSFYAGIVNTHLHNGIRTYSSAYEIGFIYGGIYILGFCRWIHEKAREQGMEKILFLARDGFIWKKIYDSLYDDIPSEYVLWSRTSGLKACIEKSRADFLYRVIDNKCRFPVFPTLAEVLEDMSLGCLTERLKEHGLSRNTLLSPETVPQAEAFCIAHWDEIVRQYQKQSDAGRRYFAPFVSGCRKVALVDVGWLGSGPLTLRHLLTQKWKLVEEAKCYLACTSHFLPSTNISYVIKGIIEPYIFAHMYNRELYDVHVRTNKGMNNSFFETFNQDNIPSFSEFSSDNGFLFQIPELENYKINKEVQEGITDFCKLYIKFCKDNEYLMNIAGYDAYVPFRMLRRNPKLLHSVFRNFSICLEPGNSTRKEHVDSIGEIMRTKNMVS